jgi:hypothetical protein
MVRKIQSLSGGAQASLKTFLGLLANAIFWLVMAAMVPVQAFLERIPELAPYAPWAPPLLYALAFWSFVRAVRSLQQLATRGRVSAKGRPSGGSASPAGRRGAKATTADHGLPAIDRQPTVQRMR